MVFVVEPLVSLPYQKSLSKQSLNVYPLIELVGYVKMIQIAKSWSLVDNENLMKKTGVKNK